MEILKKTRELTHVQRDAVNSKSSETFDRNQAKVFEETQAGKEIGPEIFYH